MRSGTVDRLTQPINDHLSDTKEKRIQTIAGPDAVIHGLRHSFRDRLREVEAPVDLIDQLGGWSLQTVGQTYGNGYPLVNLREWMLRIPI